MSGFYPDVGGEGSSPPGSSVESVTGPTVDNTDPLNPVVEAVNETAASIKSKYESNPDTNAYTDAEKANAAQQSGTNTGDETAASIKSKYESNPDTNAYTDAEKAKLAGLEDSLFLGEYPTLAALQSAHPTAPPGAYAYVDAGPGQDVDKYIFDTSDQEWIKQQGESTAETPASIKTKYESNADTNAYTDAEKSVVAQQSGTNTGDETAASIKTKYESNADTNAYTDAEKSVVAQQSGTNTGDETAASIKTKYESNADTNAYTDAEKAALPNKIAKPVTAGATSDILRRLTAGVYGNYTPVGGAVKLNNVLQGVAIAQNSTVAVNLDGGTEVFSSIGGFPRNLANQFPGQDPQNNPATFLPLIYNAGNDRWLENTVDGQVHSWRVTINYTRGAGQNNREIVCTLFNPDSAFIIPSVLIMPGGPEFLNNTAVFEFTTVADSASIGSGYAITVLANGTGSQLTINALDILIDYREKI